MITVNNNKSKPSKAWVTLITKNSYIQGGVCLARSPKRINSKYPLVVLYTKKVESENDELSIVFEKNLKLLLEEKEGCVLKQIEKVNPTKEPNEYLFKYYNDT